MLFCFYVGKGARILEVECTKDGMRKLYAGFLNEASAHAYSDFVRYLKNAGLEPVQLQPAYFVFSAEDAIEVEATGEELASSDPIKLGDAHMRQLCSAAQKRKRTPAQQIVRMLELYKWMESFARVMEVLETAEFKAELSPGDQT